jgi:hypothetical protein
LVSAPNVVPFAVTNRTGKRNRAGGVQVVRSFIAAYHVAGLVVVGKRRLLWWRHWPVGAASEPLGLRMAGERRWPAY